MLHNVLYIPDFHHNLLSVSKLLDQNCLVAYFHSSHCSFQDLSTNQLKAIGKRLSGLYIFSTPSSGASTTKHVFSSMHTNNVQIDSVVHNVSKHHISLSLLHARLGHPSIGKIKHISIQYTGDLHDFSCEPCIFAKHHKLPFPLSSSLSTSPFALIHVDIWGPYKTPSLSGASYFLTILDDHTRTTWTHLLHTKQQVSALVSTFLNYVATQFASKVKVIRSDNGTEIVQEFCAHMFAAHGIIHQK